MENFYDVLRINIRSILSPVSEETVIGIIDAIQNAGFETLSDLQFLQENDFMSVLKPIARRKLIKMWSNPGVIEELKCEYERKKNEDVRWQIDQFLAEAKKSSESTTNSVTMESIAELLKTNICRILNSVSEEILDDIIHALKFAGLELLLDLQFVREDDLTQVLNPIQRRKLVKAWSQQSILFLFSNAPIVLHEPTAADHNTHEDSSTASSLSNNVSSSTHDLAMPTQRQAYIDQTYDPSTSESSSGVPGLNFRFYGPWLNGPLPGVPDLIDQDYLPHEPPSGVPDLIDQDPLPHEPPPGVPDLIDQDPLPHEPPPGVPDLIDQDPLPHEPPPGVPDLIDQDPLPPGHPPGVPDLTDQDPSPPRSPPEVLDLTYQDPLPPRPPPEVLDLTDQDPLPPRPPPEVLDLTDQDPLPPRPPPEVLDLTYQDPLPPRPPPEVLDLTDQDPLPPALIPGVPDLINQNPLPPRPPPEVLDLTDQDPLPPAPLPGIPDLTDQNSLPPEPPLGVPDLTDQDPLPHQHPSRVSSFISIDKSILPVKSNNLPPEKCKWNQSKHLRLLQVCAKYKKELSCAKVKKNRKVWRKIAEEVSQKFNSLRCHKDRKSRLLISESECMDKIEMLRSQYHAQKNKKVLSGKMVKFFNIARNLFETSENSGKQKNIARSKKVTSPAELSSNVSVPSFKWLWNKRLALLRLYAIFKTELSSSFINKQSVWEKITEKVGKSESRKCDAKQCQDQIKSMRLEYEEMKYKRPHQLNHVQAVFFDEAENAFENSKNKVDFSVHSDLEKWTMSKPDRVKLLQVYSKYKAELSLQNFVENQIVWGKVSREISKKCSSYYGKRRCFYEINHLKRLYESYGKNNRHRDPYYFFDEAKKAFASTDCSDTYMQKAKKSYCDNRGRRNHTHLKDKIQNVQRIVVQNTNDVLQRGASLSGQHGEINSLKDFTVKQKRRSWYEHMSI